MVIANHHQHCDFENTSLGAGKMPTDYKSAGAGGGTQVRDSKIYIKTIQISNAFKVFIASEDGQVPKNRCSRDYCIRQFYFEFLF